MDAMISRVFANNGEGARPLGTLFSERRENGFGHLPILAVTIAGKVVPRESLERSVIDKTGTEKYLRVCPGDIAYNTMRMWQGSCGVVAEEGIISSAYTVLVPNREEVDPDFWNYAFHTPELLDWFRRFSTGVAADRWRLYYKSFAKIPVRVPTLSLQRKFLEEVARSERAAATAQTNAVNLGHVLHAVMNTFFRPRE
jgi:type I restriction enzyme S subunit